MLDKVNSDLLMLCQFISGYIMLGHVRSGYVRFRFISVMSCYFRL